MPAAALVDDALKLFPRIRVGDPHTVDRLVVLPLFGGPGGPDADLIDETIPTGKTQIAELGEDGVVNLLRITHLGDRPLLLIDGEQVHGALQDRVFNASLVVAPRATTTVPVSCVERGRWHYRPPAPGSRHLPRNLESSEVTLPAYARGRKLHRVADAALRGTGYDANQRRVWDERTATISTTSACLDAYRQHRARTEARLRMLSPVAGQTGIAVYHGRRLVSLDLFGSATLFQRAWAKIGRGIAADSYTDVPHYDAAASNCRSALSVLATATNRRTQCLDGCGPTLHGLVGNWAFSVALYEGQMFHAIVARI